MDSTTQNPAEHPERINSLDHMLIDGKQSTGTTKLRDKTWQRVKEILTTATPHVSEKIVQTLVSKSPIQPIWAQTT